MIYLIFIIVIIILSFIYIPCIINNKKLYIEKFDQNNIKNIAINKLNSFNYNYNKPFLDFYFNKLIYNNLNNIDLSYNFKIFVSIASYRDPQCSFTLHNIIDMALKPENLVIVIYQQNDINDLECLNEIDTKGAIIKFIKTSNIEAKGPCWARFIIQQLWQGEEYFLQIDSHTRFIKNWDMLCINELEYCNNLNNNNNKVCLTNYVSLYNLKTGQCEIDPLRGPMYVVEIDNDDGFFRYNSLFKKNLKNPTLSKGWSGCFSFSKSNIIYDAPYDPYTPFLFFGEEMDIFARLYTHGWFIYVPSIPICFTVFDRSYRKTFWEHPDQQPVSQLSKLRLYYRFGLIDNIVDELKIDIENYSLGKERTFNDFLKYSLE
jgi:[Skp1-protein]-hydroxyproline N-acetylglucosaminyltransferase